MRQPDFQGWATKNDLKCGDGRTIRKNAFKDCDGQTVPLVWQHMHDSPENVLGHCLLENRAEGVYTYGWFNDSDLAQKAKQAVDHKDITNLSIYANKLKQSGKDVLHGVIREVSLVLAGANPGAKIEFPVLTHSMEESEDEAVIYTDEPLVLMHSDMPVPNKKLSPLPLMPVPQATPLQPLPLMKEPAPIAHSDVKKKTVGDVLETLNNEQKKIVSYVVDQAIEFGATLNDKDEGGDDDMSHNLFENGGAPANTFMSKEDWAPIFRDAKQCGSLKEAVLAHMDENGALAHTVTDDEGNEVTYGVANIDYLFPDAKKINDTPDFIQRDMDWVQDVMQNTHHTPFSRVKSIHADITMEEARARGYTKGKRKVEEVFALLKRSTDPQTVYKKQKLDRDDILDITDMNVVAWIKREMRMMLEEEIARAIMIGDGRANSSDDKISELHIRPIMTDDIVYNLPVFVTEDNTREGQTYKNLIKAVLRARKDYKGSGNPTFYTTEDVLTEMLLLEDGIGRRLYNTEAEVATALRVKKIVTVPVFENISSPVYDADHHEIGTLPLLGIIVNLHDYNIGADKGGETAMFDDFDIDFNQYKYLIETRISGAMVKPKSAMTVMLGERPTGNNGGDSGDDSGNT